MSKLVSNEMFSLQSVKDLLDQAKFAEVHAYLSSYFFKSGIHIYFRDGSTGTFRQYSTVDAKKLLPDDLDVWVNGLNNRRVKQFDLKKYLSSWQFLKDEHVVTIDFHKPLVFSGKTHSGQAINYLNMARPMTSYDHIKCKRKDYVKQLDVVYNHIKVVWCDNKPDVYEYIMNFLACSMSGKRKLRTCLNLECNKERAGRGTILNFINKILGDRMHKTSSVEAILKYTKPFEGRSLINLDELPSDASNYRSIGDAMKSLITEPTFDCRDMYSSGYTQKNTFNIIITSNNSAISLTQSNNVRYFVAPINTCMTGKTKYFAKLNAICANEKVQKLFYEDMVDRFTSKCAKWNEDHMPDTKDKLDKLIESLPKFLQWFKKEYALKKKDLNMTTTAFLEDYYSQTRDNVSKIRISKMLQQLGITSKAVSKNGKTRRFYIRSGESILQAFKKQKWISDDFDNVIPEKKHDEEHSLDLDKYSQALREIDALKKQVKKLTNQLKDGIKNKALERQYVDTNTNKPRVEAKGFKPATKSADVFDFCDDL